MLFTGEKTPPFIAKECPEMGQLNIDWARLQATAEKKRIEEEVAGFPPKAIRRAVIASATPMTIKCNNQTEGPLNRAESCPPDHH